MAVIEDVFGYVPYLRVEGGELKREGEINNPPAEKAVASYDEDEITLAYEAGKEIAEKVKEEVDDFEKVCVIFVSSSYRLEKDPCSTLCMAFDFPENTKTFFISGSVSAVVKAIDLADKLIRSGFEKVLILTGDVRRSANSNVDLGMSDAGGCILISDEKKAKQKTFKINRVKHISEETWDLSSLPNGEITVSDERHISLVQYMDIISGLKDSGRMILNVPTFNILGDILRRMKQKDDIARSFGVLGNSHIPISLSYIMAELKAGDKVSVIGFGSGAVSAELEFIGEKEKANEIHEKMLQVFERKRKITFGKYIEIRNKRGFPEDEGSISLLWRERKQNLRFEGLMCLECKNVFFPSQNYCPVCGGEKFEKRKLSKKGKVFTMTEDYLTAYSDIFQPLPMLVVELEGGGRVYLQGTDIIPTDSPEKIRVGDEVELTLRILNTDHAFRNYFWKARKIL